MTFIASFPSSSLAAMVANELNSGAPPCAPRFEASQQPDADGRFRVSADQNIQPMELGRLRQFIRNLAFGSQARWMEYLLEIRVDHVPCNWKFRVADGRSSADYVTDLERASRPEAGSSYDLDVSMMTLADGWAGEVQKMRATVRADSLDDLLSALITAVGCRPVAGGGPGQTIRS